MNLLLYGLLVHSDCTGTEKVTNLATPLQEQHTLQQYLPHLHLLASLADCKKTIIFNKSQSPKGTPHYID